MARNAQYAPRGRRVPAVRPPLFATLRAYGITVFLIVLCGAFGTLTMMAGAITFVTCERNHHAIVSCVAQARILGFLPIQTQAISNIRAVEAVVKRYERTGFNNKGVDYHDVLVFHGTNGSRTNVSLGDGWKFGMSASEIEGQVNALIHDPGPQGLALWHGSLKGLVMLLFGLPSLLVAFVLLAAVLYGHYRVYLRQS